MSESGTKRFTSWVLDLLKQYLAPAGIGAIVTAVATLGATIPRIEEKTRQLNELERDIAAYSKVIQRFYPLLESDQLRSLFPSNAQSLLSIDENPGKDTWFSAQLRRSPEGVFFLTCEGGMSSRTSGAFYGTWLIRGEAVRWAQKYVGPEEFQTVFDLEDLKRVSQLLDIDLCGERSFLKK